MISRLEGAILVALYGAYLVEQLIGNGAPSYSDEYRLIALVLLLPGMLVFLTWQVLAWRRQRRQPG
ncbi:MAG: hypothetical protein ACKOPS_07240 [Cyanobium sp.]